MRSIAALILTFRTVEPASCPVIGVPHMRLSNSCAPEGEQAPQSAARPLTVITKNQAGFRGLWVAPRTAEGAPSASTSQRFASHAPAKHGKVAVWPTERPGCSQAFLLALELISFAVGERRGMNARRGFFRLWVVSSALWLMGVGVVAFQTYPKPAQGLNG